MRVEPFAVRHSDRTTVGFRLRDPLGMIGYTGDTGPFHGLAGELRKARILVISNTRPRGASIPYHMSTDESAILVAEVRPELAVLTHFGLKLLHGEPEKEAEWVESSTGIRTVCAQDGMVINVGGKISVR